jgi:hypothetical protein
MKIPRVTRITDGLASDKTGDVAIRVFLSAIEAQLEAEGIPESAVLPVLEWADPPDAPPITYEEAVRRALRETTIDGCHAVLKRALRKTGRRVTKRRLAVRAYVSHEYLPKWSWNIITQKLCPCGKHLHDQKCVETLRAEVNHLKRLMKEYQLTLR